MSLHSGDREGLGGKEEIKNPTRAFEFEEQGGNKGDFQSPLGLEGRSFEGKSKMF